MWSSDSYVCCWTAGILLVLCSPLPHAPRQLYSTSGHWAGFLVSAIWCALFRTAHTFWSRNLVQACENQARHGQTFADGCIRCFLGISFAPGGTWNGEYLVEEMTYFLDIDFCQEAPGHSRVLTPHVTKQVRLPANGIVVFPLKRHYD